jgi:hypothetical protein
MVHDNDRRFAFARFYFQAELLTQSASGQGGEIL